MEEPDPLNQPTTPATPATPATPVPTVQANLQPPFNPPIQQYPTLPHHTQMVEPFSQPTVTISQCVTLRLQENNYLLWKLQFEQFLSSQMLLGFVTGATQRPTPTLAMRNGDQIVEVSNPEFIKWMRSDQLVMAWLYGSLSENALRSVYGLKSSHEVWFSLAKKYNRVSATRKLDLQRKIQSTTKVGKTMTEYLAEIKSLCDQLDSIGSPISEHEKISGALTGLGKEYESISTVIEESMETYPGPCFEDVVFKLTNFEDKIQKYESSVNLTPHLAFNTQKSEYGQQQQGYTDSNRGGYTNRGGYSNRGRGQNRGGYRGGRNSYSTRGRGFQQQFINSQNRPTCQICGKYGHSAFRCYHRFEEEYYNSDFAQALNAMRLSDQEKSSGQEWFPDTGATAHVTNSASSLQNTKYYSGDDSVIVGNGEFLPITHTGSTVLQGHSDQAAPHARKQNE